MQQSGFRYQQMFNHLDSLGQGAFVPFVTMGDPGPEQSLRIIKTLIDAGADALELGIPFSDPSADGVTIQDAANRALGSGVTTETCIDIIKQVREYAPQIPIGLLLYANQVFARGIEQFYADMQAAGVDSVLIADVPIRESLPFRKAAMAQGIAPIFVAPPNASDDALREIASFGRGYTYVLSRAGVTGTEVAAKMPSETLINRLNEYHAAPAILGFGISTPEQVAQAMASGAKGAISGSAVVKIIARHLDSIDTMCDELCSFVKEMKAATVR